MADYKPTTEELAQATENTLSQSEWVINGVPAEIEEVGQTVDGEIDVRTTAGMFTRSEFYNKIAAGEIKKV